jgi:hypothetical protein
MVIALIIGLIGIGVWAIRGRKNDWFTRLTNYLLKEHPVLVAICSFAMIFGGCMGIYIYVMRWREMTQRLSA